MSQRFSNFVERLSLGSVSLSLLLLLSCADPGRNNPKSIVDHSKSPAPACTSPAPLAVEEEDDLNAPVIVGNVDLDKNPNTPLGRPTRTDGDTEIIISRSQYVLSWNFKTRLLNWAAWLLTAAQLGSAPRPQHFDIDPQLHAIEMDRTLPIRAVDPDEYEGSCFDRGHIVPAGDRTGSEKDDVATFVMSNVIPQSAYANRVTWKHLEVRNRHLVRTQKKRLLIIAGPVLSEKPYFIGPGKDIPVPVASFKIVVPLDDSGTRRAPEKAIVAVLIPNLTSRGTDATVDHDTACEDSRTIGKEPDDWGHPRDWMDYQTTVGNIEKKTGLSFRALGIQ